MGTTKAAPSNVPPPNTQTVIQVEAFVEGDGCDRIPEVTITQYQTWLQTWLQALQLQLSPINAYEVSLRLTNDAEIQQLNTDYRQQAKPTDVLSFAALETDIPGADALHQEQPLYLGDIIISVETAARQAPASDHSLTQEIAWLSAHGLLHLLGWDHPDDASLARMLEKQAQLLSLITL
ncbi:MAG: rRNA maturation RNase YbeY [Cyanobacteria bacterium J06598_3]